MMAETQVGVSPTEPQMRDPREAGSDAVAGSDASTAPDEQVQPASGRAPSEQDLAAVQRLVRQAQEDGVALTGPDGLLKMLTKTVIEVALDEEMSSHLGYDKHAVQGRGSGNSRNAVRSKTVITVNAGPVEIDVPRDRAGTFEPQLVRKRQRRLTDLDAMVLSVYAKGLTTGEISAHLGEVFPHFVGGAPRRERVQGHDQPHHRPGRGGDAGLVGAAAGEVLRGDLHRRDRGQGACVRTMHPRR